MEIRQFKYFVRIVELGSLSRAAKDLYIAQPALSAQINNLEKELGARLLARSVRGVTPTDAGHVLYLHAQAVLRQIERLRHDVQGTKPSGPVSVGIPTSAANMIAGPLIELVMRRYPEIQLRIVESLSGHLYELAVNGRLELSLLFEPHPDASRTERIEEMAPNKSARYRALLDEELFLIHAPTADVMTSECVTLEDMASMRLVLPGRANITRRIIDHAFDLAGVKMDLLAEIDSLSTIQSIVEEGQAATVLSLSAFVGSDARHKLAVRRIENLRLIRRLCLFSSDVVGLGFAADKVAALIPDLVNGLVESGRWAGATVSGN